MLDSGVLVGFHAVEPPDEPPELLAERQQRERQVLAGAPN